MIQQEDFDKYCREGEDFIRVQDNHYPKGDLCFVLEDEGYACLYNCSNGLDFGVPITSIGDMGLLYQILTDKELTITK
jgi:hypothetical protein